MLKQLFNNLSSKNGTNNNIKNDNGSSFLLLDLYLAIALIAVIISVFIVRLVDITEVIIIISLLLLLFKTRILLRKQNKLITDQKNDNSDLSIILDHSPDVYMAIKENGDIIYAQDKFKKILSNCVQSKSGIFHINDLPSTGLISQDEFDKLLKFVSNSKDTNINLNMLVDSNSNSNNNFSLHQVGINNIGLLQNKLKLSTEKTSSISDLFLLKTKTQITKEEDSIPHFSDSFNIGYYRLDQNGIIIEVNNAFSNIFEDQNNSLIGLKLDILIETINQNIQLDYKLNFEELAFTKLKDKTNKIVLFCNRPINSMSEGLVVIVKNYNIFELGNNCKLSSHKLVNNHPLSTAIIDINLNVIEYNNAFSKLFSLDNNQDKLKLDQLLKCANGNNFKTVFLDFIENNIYKKTSIDVEIKTNENKSSSLYARKIVDSLDNYEGFIISLIDTTDLKSLQISFTHSQKMQAVGQLAGGVAHDFNNLLTAMLGFCDLLLNQHKPSDPSFANIIQIKQNANRAANLVKQLLAFSRKQTLQPKVIDVTDTIADLSNLIGRLIGAKIKLNIQHGRDLGNVRVDKIQLEQVIVNLAVNARDAMPDSGTLTIRTTNRKVNSKSSLAEDLIPPSVNDEIITGEYVLIEVIDNGCGIEREKILKIFDPFFSTKAIGSGTGLGLSTVYGIVKQTDGYIYVSSKVGEGTTFSVFLNRCFEEIEIEKTVEAEISYKTDSKLTKSNTILLVEDEDAVRIFTTNALKSKGYKVIAPLTVHDALQVIDEKGDKIDLVISDVIMPGMNGPDMIKIVHEKYPELKVIFISGYGEDAFVETYGNARHFNFLSKPYSLKSLVQKVREVIDK